METVSENEAIAASPDVIEEEEDHDDDDDIVVGDNGHADEDADTVGEMPLPGVSRGVRRLKSSVSIARRGPQRGGVKRATSMRTQQPPLSASRSAGGGGGGGGGSTLGVGRSTSSHSGLSRATTTGSVSTGSRNTSIGRQSHHTFQRGPPATLERHESEMSLGDVSIGDGSVFTMDSVYLRKGQMIADPLEAGTYAEEDSFADHESFMTRDDYVPIEECASPARREIKPRISGLDELNLMAKLQIGSGGGNVISNNGEFDDTVSFMTGASGLTTDYTEDSEYGCDEVHCAE